MIFILFLKGVKFFADFKFAVLFSTKTPKTPLNTQFSPQIRAEPKISVKMQLRSYFPDSSESTPKYVFIDQKTQTVMMVDPKKVARWS